MASEIIVQTIKAPTSGANANKVIIPSGVTLDASAGELTPPAGAVIQTVTSRNTGSAIQTSSTAFVATGLSVNITPKYQNSKIIISFSATFTSSSGDQSHSGTQIKFYRGIAGGAAGQLWSGNGFLNYNGSASTYHHAAGSVFYDDTPNTTSQVNYYVYMARLNNGTASIQRDWGGIVLMAQEIAQ